MADEADEEGAGVMLKDYWNHVRSVSFFTGCMLTSPPCSFSSILGVYVSV